MTFRKIKATRIFNGYHFEPEESVLITGEGGKVIAIVDSEAAGTDVETYNGILSPGFINCHCHLELSHLQNRVAPGSGLVDFLLQVVQKRTINNIEEPDTVEAKQKAIREAATEMYQHGIVAVGDICNTTDSLQAKINSPLAWSNFIEVLNLVDEKAGETIQKHEAIITSYREHLPASPTALSPHAPYTLSPQTARLINQHTAGQLISMHNQETAAEDELFKTGKGAFLKLFEFFQMPASPLPVTGRSSLASWLPYFNEQQKILLVHNTYTTHDDVVFATDYANTNSLKLFYCICINANLYIENQAPPIDLFMQHSCHLVLGTDSYSSNFQLSILAEIKMIKEHFPEVPHEKILQWATSNGAIALGMENKLGSFEKGKQPGIVLISNDYTACKRLY